MLPLVLSVILGVAVPYIVLSEWDKKAGRTITLGRGAFVGWFLVVFCLCLIGGFIGSEITGGVVGTHTGMAISLAYLATRRLLDIGLSPWWALLGLLFPLSLFGHIVIMFIPGSPRHAATPQATAPQPGQGTRPPGSATAAAAPPPPQPRHQPPALITLLQAGETYGPYATHQLLELWDTGQVAGNASYWREGMADYRPLAPDVERLRTLAGTGMA